MIPYLYNYFFLQSIFNNIKADLPLLAQTSIAEITKTKGLDAHGTNIVKIMQVEDGNSQILKIGSRHTM